MASLYPASLRRLINELSKLPSIGERSATRLAYHLLTVDRNESKTLVSAISEMVETTRLCKICHFITDKEICPLCSDANRNAHLLCVVEKPADVIAIERSGGFRGFYHVLHGVWSPLRGVSPDDTKITHLLTRLEGKGIDEDPLNGQIEELILATGTTVEGDATALYLAQCVEERGISVTRIAQGMPKGGELEYADEMTLNLSLEGRRRM